MLRALTIAFALCLTLTGASRAVAQDTPPALQDVLQAAPEEIADPSRRTVQETIDRLVASDAAGVATFLERWAAREVFQRVSDGLFFYAVETDAGHDLFDIATGEAAGTAGPRELTPIRPNAGVRGVIEQALVATQLADDDPNRRLAALETLARDPSADALEPLRAALADADPALADRKARLERLLTAQFDPDIAARIDALRDLGTDISTDARAVLNQTLRADLRVATALPEGANIAAVLTPGSDALSLSAAHALLVEEGLSPPALSDADLRAALVAAVSDGQVGGIPVAELSDPARREAAFDALVAAGTVPAALTGADIAAAVDAHVFYLEYRETSAEVTTAAAEALDAVEARVAAWQTADIALDAVSLASIYFLAAIGLAITFGVMGVINMAHGEFIMIGAYTAYVVQLLVPDYTLSLAIALPLAFVVTFAGGVAMERLVIRHLAHRPLETLLATFGISIALQQLAKNIFGTQARPLTAPEWLNGAWQVNDIFGISLIRIAIFVLALLFLVLLLLVLNRTRLGLEVRAVTQNPGMAASVGIDPARIRMLTFGLGSGIAGIAGVAIGLYAQVTSEMGANYIVQSFMAVVVGGVGNVWGTLAGATLIGGLQKVIEFFNPSNTLAAQTFMILFIIIFIQFRPRGIVALRGRAAGV